MAANRPRVGISQCLLGDLVRYDGGHKRDHALVTLASDVEWVRVCPEMEVGMGAPRERIHLVASPDGVVSGPHTVRLLGLSSRHDWTERMASFAERRARELAGLRLSGFVLKKNSPSCGPEGVPIAGDVPDATGRGLFAQALIDALPGLPIEDEERLRDPDILARFLDQVRRRATGATADPVPRRKTLRP